MNESRSGANHRLTVTRDQPLLAYLLESLDLKRSAVKNLLKFGAVQINGEAVRQFDHPLVSGDVVTVGALQTAVAIDRLEHARIQIVFEDDALLVVDKPPGLLTVATDSEKRDTLHARLNAYLHDRDPAHPERGLVAHRLDQETSGLVLFAKSESVKRLLQDAWPTVEKYYYAIVRGCPTPEQGTITSYLSEDSASLKVSASSYARTQSHLATTHYRIIKTCGVHSLLEVRLETGRKHQIRVQLASLECPVVGDRRYGRRSRLCDRLALHASELRLSHPLTGAPLKITLPLPKALRKLIT